MRFKKLPSFLKSLPVELIQSLLNDGQVTLNKYKTGKIIHFEGEKCSSLELILSGSVFINRIDSAGNLMTIGELGPDGIIGGNLVFSKKPIYAMTVVAKTDLEVFTIHKKVLFELLTKYDDFLLSYLESTSDNALLLGNTIKYHIHTSLRERIFHFIYQEIHRQGNHTIVLPMTKKALAEILGVQRTSLSRELKKMKDENIIDYNRETITLLKSLN